MQVKTNLKAGQVITVNIGQLYQNNESYVSQVNAFVVSAGPSGE